MGLTKIAEQKLKAVSKNLDIVIKENAKKSEYAKSLVIDISGKNSDAASQLAGLIKGNVLTTVPDGEKTPDNTDVLVILGVDYTGK